MLAIPSAQLFRDGPVGGFHPMIPGRNSTDDPLSGGICATGTGLSRRDKACDRAVTEDGSYVIYAPGRRRRMPALLN